MAFSRWLGSCLSLAFAATVPTTHGYYLPGINPQTFQRGEDVPLKVNALTSVHTLIPKEHHSLPFCHPENGVILSPQTLGEFLTGNRIQNSPYLIETLEEIRCRKLCQVQLDSEEARILQQHIREGYHNNWILDNIPAANSATHNMQMQQHYGGGFPIGFVDVSSNDAYIFNHVKIMVDYHQEEFGYRVVKFAVEPISCKHRFENGFEWDGISMEGFYKKLDTCPADTSDFISQEYVEKVQIVKAGQKILYTYDVTWRKSDVPWASRWDVYLTEDGFVPSEVHWYSIINSSIVVAFLSVTVTCILVKNLRKDVAATRGRSAPPSEEDSAQMEDAKGWKALHGDVFRPPQTQPMLLCAFVGTGSQLVVTGCVVIVLAMCGLVSPARRGSLLNTTLTVYALCSCIAGFVSSCLYKAIGGSDWKQCNQVTATLFSGIAFGQLVVFNVLFAFVGSTACVPVPGMLILLCVWGFISIPLNTFGSYIGYMRYKAFEFPTETFPTAREIPPPSTLWKTPILSMLITGCFTFAAVYVELFFIMTSLWMNQYYYVFGFAFLVYSVVLVTCSEVTILAVYYRLNAENHRWWWQAFFWSGSIGFYTFGYSMIWFSSLEASSSLMVFSIYHGYMLLVSFAIFLGFGSVGFVAAMLFVRRMYSVVNQVGGGYVELLDASEQCIPMEHELDLTEQGT